MSLLIGARKPLLPMAAALVVAGIPGAKPLAAQERAEAMQEKASGREHLVRTGDTLWDLAQFYLSNPFLWTRIHEANRSTVANPHRIYPNERLIIPEVAAEAAADAVAVAGGEAPQMPETPAEAERSRFYRPVAAASAAPAAGEVVIAGRTVPLPAVTSAEFNAAPWLGDWWELSALGEMVRVRGREIQDRLAQGAHPLDGVYLRYRSESRPEVGDRLLMVRKGRTVRSWGHVIQPVAIVTVAALEKEVMRATVERQFGPLMPSDLAVSLEAYPALASGAAQPVEEGPTGELIGFEEEQSLYGVRERAFVSLGAGDGVEVGDELVVRLPERRAGGGYGEQLPAEPIARLRVLKVRDRTATVAVMQLVSRALEPGLPVQLVARAP